MAIKRARNPPSTASQQPSKRPKKSAASPPYLPDDILMPMSTTSTFVTAASPPYLPDDILMPMSTTSTFVTAASPPYLPDDILLPMSTTGTFVTFNDDEGVVFLDDKLRSNGINLEVGENTSIRGLLASTNGLLCLYCSEPNEKFLYVCNPATREGHRVPLPPVSFLYSLDSIGLVFDPTKSPHRYTLVHPMQKPERDFIGARYRFMVFSSDCRQWIESDQVVDMEHVTIPWSANKPVLADGVLYWSCTHYLLYFDYGNKQSGYIPLPEELPRFAGQEIGVCEGRVTYTRLHEDLEVWMLDRSQSGGSDEWDRLCQVSLETLPPSFVQTMRLTRGKSVSQALVTRYKVTPLPFEGDDHSVVLRLVARCKTRYHQEKSTLRYDISTGKLAEVFNGDHPCSFQEDQLVFGYCSTMLPLPK